MRLARELGVMTLDTDGKWLEEPLPNAKLNGVRPPQALQGLIDPEALSELGETADLIPPDVSEEFIKLVESLPEKFQLPIPRSVEQNAALSDSNGSVNSGK